MNEIQGAGLERVTDAWGQPVPAPRRGWWNELVTQVMSAPAWARVRLEVDPVRAQPISPAPELAEDIEARPLPFARLPVQILSDHDFWADLEDILTPPGANEKPGPLTDRGNASTDSRKARLLELLKERGLSIVAWASKAKVDYHTAQNYLEGRRRSYDYTRQKLAGALGIKPEELP